MKSTKIHKWRLCPLGRHWVREHILHTKNKITKRRGHCANNPTKKDQLYFDEITEIDLQYFGKLRGLPSNNNLGYIKNGNAYDKYIRGWTRYWNEVLDPNTPLDPDLVKALIASESGFNKDSTAKVSKHNFARGLMQITDSTQKIMSDEDGELKDHYINIDQKELNDPNSNICAGIRWLFRKKETATSKLGREATWEEATADYKGYLDGMISGKNPNPKGMENFKNNYKKLKGK